MIRRVAIDIGGTFTDVALLHDDRSVDVFKVPSNRFDPVEAVRGALGRVPGQQVGRWERVLHATTIGTNALLERKLPPIALLTTSGFRDVIQFRRLKRASRYSLRWTPPPPLVSRDLVLEVQERVAAGGTVVTALTEQEVDRVVEWVRRAGVPSVAICLLHSYANSSHEAMLAERLGSELPGLHVTLSSSVSPEPGEYERTSTTVAHAVLRGVMSEYLGQLEAELAHRTDSPLLMMQSSGGLTTARRIVEAPANAIESGPAAGALFASAVARELGIGMAVSLDIGGTTAKACLIEEGQPSEAGELRVGGEMHTANGFTDPGGYVVRGRAVDLVEVGAGGGSICRVDGQGALHVGPESAGSDPGPAAYGQGGELPTVTDANVVLGFLKHGPTASGVTLDRAAAARALGDHVATPLGVSVEDAAWLVYQVANSNMMRALQAVSTERGRSLTPYTLLAFGGAGPTHACAIASELGMTSVVVPRTADTFSAVGLHSCSARHDVQRAYRSTTSMLEIESLDRAFGELEAEAESSLAADGFVNVSVQRFVDARFVGQNDCLTVAIGTDELDAGFGDVLVKRFRELHATEYGHADGNAIVEVAALRVRSEGLFDAATGVPRPSTEAVAAAGVGDDQAYFGPDAGWLATPRLTFEQLQQHAGIDGPALVQLAQATVVVPVGGRAAIEGSNVRVHVRPTEITTLPGGGWEDRAALQLFRNRLGAAVDRMASTLARTAYSPLLTDAHDFSVAIVDPVGRVVDQGVGSLTHLGSVSTAMEALMASDLVPLAPGDVVVLNDPYEGGTHLPDCIVIVPVFCADELVAHTVSIGHLSDIGGHSSASSFASGAHELIQEGLIIPPVKFFDRGTANSSVHRLIRRNVRQAQLVMGDLHALVASARAGGVHIERLVAEVGTARAATLFEDLIAYAAERGRAELSALGDVEGSFVDFLDGDGEGGGPVRLQVELRLTGGEVWVDLTGSSEQRCAGINTTLGAARSAIQYCIRTQMSPDFPDNSGFYPLVHIEAPPGTVMNAAGDAPVANRGLTAGRLVEAVFGAMALAFPGSIGAAGDAQCDPVAFSGRRADGSRFLMIDMVAATGGAHSWADGIEGVAMTLGNFQNISVERLEERYPEVRITHYATIPGSGGNGRFRGGNAVSRGYELLADEADVFFRVDRQLHPPWGLDGGGPGAPARSTLITADGERHELVGWQTLTMHAGDRLIRTGAGGGGFGDPLERNPDLRVRDLREERVDLDTRT